MVTLVLEFLLAPRPGQNRTLLGIGRAARVMALKPRILIYTRVSEMAATGHKRTIISLRELQRERRGAERGLAAISGSLDPVFILGQGFSVFAYLRNLYFIKRERRAGPAAK